MAAELAKAGIDISPLGKWGWGKEYSTPRDKLYTDVAIYLLKEKKVNLLLLHLITPDGVEHAYGPHTREAYQAVAESDVHLRSIWNVLNEPPFAGRSAMFVVSDHGFAPYDKMIRPNVVLKELGLIAVGADGKVTDRRAWCVPQGGSAFVYLLNAERQKETVSQVHKKLADLEGVSAVLTPEEFSKLGLPSPKDNSEAPDLVLLTGPGYSFADAASGPAVVNAGGHKGTHGHDPRPDYMHATFVAAGAGIKPGVKLKTIKNTDVAPTIARLLGVELKNVDGRALSEVLVP
jgi:predicted AlkP superfamily pyrophosphatase or phosphodiesterase